MHRLLLLLLLQLLLLLLPRLLHLLKTKKKINHTSQCFPRKVLALYVKQAFAKFFDVFAKFFDVFDTFPTCFYAFGYIQIHSDTFGCFRQNIFVKKKIEKKKSSKISQSFSMFSGGFGGAGGKRTSKSASASNFAPDRPILRSVRPKIVKK